MQTKVMFYLIVFALGASGYIAKSGLCPGNMAIASLLNPAQSLSIHESLEATDEEHHRLHCGSLDAAELSHPVRESAFVRSSRSLYKLLTFKSEIF